MDKETLVKSIIELEWPMFRDVNGDDRADCQENEPMFVKMRSAQFSVWNEQTLLSYRDDLIAAKKEGRNLLRDKYINMMASTDPELYARMKRELPEPGEKKLELTESIWRILLRQTVLLRSRYPEVGRLGRPLLAADERDGWASVETYEKGELLTYSEKTLALLLQCIRGMEAEGVSFAERIQENGVMSEGYASLEEAERDAARRRRP
ncbi:MAG: DUF4125 family protein [Oscillospiraceae bacterium]|jgi:hypothetical protein|nr:DUF4125 family protein [Oscillospiraceae bacterium]